MRASVPARRAGIAWCILAAAVTIVLPLAAAEDAVPLRERSRAAVKRAVAFFREKVAVHGGYVYYCDEAVTQRWGEGKAGPDTIFVQRPGTPTVGDAFLSAYRATGDPVALAAAREAAEALVYGQLQSGGWTQVIHFAPAPRMGKYRNGKGGNWNASSLDDGQTQDALQFLMRVDQALEFKHPAIHEAAQYGLSALLKAQFPNGGFPQVWEGPAPARPITAARYPDYDWRTEGRVKNYWECYTLNDNLAGSVCATLLTAHQIYGEPRFRASLERLGEFLLLAQMPDPQPAWCQQYSAAMIPVWARKFEPPAVTGWESQDAMRTLIRIARTTGDVRFLAPIPRALAYLRKSLLPDGRVARFYELQSNRPLYMDAEYRLTYSDAAAPEHYGWKQSAALDAIEGAYQDALAGRPEKVHATGREVETVSRVLTELDDRGRWVSTYSGEKLVGQPRFTNGFRYLSSDRFSRNLGLLCDYLGSPKGCNEVPAGRAAVGRAHQTRHLTSRAGPVPGWLHVSPSRRAATDWRP